eukprot:NODE_1371_length_616_cov_768.373898_g1085_i0.p1 GENE.NODE_1371_length_616_cov_768.373898_g1085_i0~~NODE_1371_length_616_cov_768.373898_g1085_i0.p1  ORF type:complete len:186 (+),score=35.81 NODE_1371_length_616_cov_768.373898_g1085_i0:26-559(+)
MGGPDGKPLVDRSGSVYGATEVAQFSYPHGKYGAVEWDWDTHGFLMQCISRQDSLYTLAFQGRRDRMVTIIDDKVQLTEPAEPEGEQCCFQLCVADVPASSSANPLAAETGPQSQVFFVLKHKEQALFALPYAYEGHGHRRKQSYWAKELTLADPVEGAAQPAWLLLIKKCDREEGK